MESHSVAILFAVAVGAMAIPLAPHASAAEANPVVVRIGGEQMTREQIAAQLGYEPATLLTRIREDDNFARIYAVRWFQAGLFARAAKEDGLLTRTPGLEQAASNLGRNLIADEYTRDLMRTEFKPTDNEIETYYGMYKNTVCATGPRYHFARMGVEIAKHASDEERAGATKRLEKMRARIAAGERFATIADEMSDLPSKNPGGDVGWITGEELAKDESAGLSQLAVGAVSEPLKTRRGLEIFQMVEKDDGKPLSLKECRPNLVERIEREYRKSTAQRRADELAERYDASLDLGGFIAAARSAEAILPMPDPTSRSEFEDAPKSR